MLEKLEDNPGKILAPTRFEMMPMFRKSFNDVKLDTSTALKHNFILKALDGSEDYMVTDRLMELVAEEIKDFRTQLLTSEAPNKIEQLIKTITPQEGVTRAVGNEQDKPQDEGTVLLDCEGHEIDPGQHKEILDEDVEIDWEQRRPAPSTSSSQINAIPIPCNPDHDV